MKSPVPHTTPELHATAVNIARMCRIVVQLFLPPEVRAEAERRFYLTARGELEQLYENTGNHS
jgi:hypothetical protein